MQFISKFLNRQSFNPIKTKNFVETYTFSLLFISVFITTILLAIRYFGGLQILELFAYDWLVNLPNQEQKDKRLLVVEITDKDIANQNRWPISDATIAQLLATLQKYEPKAIGLDIYRDIVHPPGSEALAQQLQADNVVVIHYTGKGDNRVLAHQGVKPEQIGFNDVVLDADDVLRRHLMYVRLSEEKELYSFSLRLSLKYLRDRTLTFKVNQDSLQIGNTVFADLKPDSGGYQMQSSEALGWQTLIPFRSPDIAQRVTLTEVLAGKIDPSSVKGKVVLIGTTAPSIKDSLYTPYKGSKSIMPGVIIHAQMVSQILSAVEDNAPQFWFWQWWVEDLWIWGWSLTGIVIAWRFKHPLVIAGAGLISLGGLWGFCVLAYTQFGWIPFVPAAFNFILAAGIVLGYKVLYTLFYDSLTGLPNRSLFAKQLEQLHQRSKFKDHELIVVLCLDLERFRLINDALGYEAGDLLLIRTAQRLQSQLNLGAILARIGADEFAIALKINETKTSAMEIANQLQQQLAIPFEFKEQEIFTSVSIGLAVNSSPENFKAEELFRASHTAMYQAKASGKTHHQVFASKMHEQAFKRLQLETDLHEAIDNQEFELYYQPIISLQTGTISGFEALVRWISPTRGFISPGAFIPVAEETGLIIPMGKWILGAACSQMRSWQEQFDYCSSMLISVNLSTKQFSQANLVEQIEEILQISQLDATNLKLEITESMVMDDVENTITLLNRLKDLGIKLSMDDFGTGFSSFSYLHRFPMDTLKVDRSFVCNMSNGGKNQEIVSTIIMLAHKLGMDVVAEGIETETEKQILRTLRAEYGQGYLFAKPLTAKDATQLIADRTQW